MGGHGRSEAKLWAALLVPLVCGAVVGSLLGAPDVPLERLGPLGGSCLVVLVLTWTALSAWLDELDDDSFKAGFERVDRYVKLGLPMFAAGAAWAVAAHAAVDVERVVAVNVVWAVMFLLLAVARVLIVVAAWRR